jgi:hypothetical protein
MIRGGKSMKKKLAVLGLTATMVMSLCAGCGGKETSGGKDASGDKGSVYYLNFKGRWRWGFTDSYSGRFQTAYPYFSDFTPAGTNPALSDPFKVYCHVSKTRCFSHQLFPFGGLHTVYLGISTTNRFLCRHSIS